VQANTLRLIALAAALASGTASADIRPLVGAAFTGGGETLVTVQYTNGKSQNIKSGGLLHLFGGFEWQQTGSPFALQANLGYHVDDTNADNGSVKFKRMPVELIGFWSANDDWRFGAGLRKSNGVKLSSSGAASNFGSTKLGSKTGFLIQGEYLVGKASFYLRWVGEDYTVNQRSVDGNHLGLGASWRF
jgi:hypothetical protein